MKKETSRSLQATKTRALIIDYVLDCLKTQTYDQISIPRLCKELHLSVGAFYHHFHSKEEIIYTVFTHIETVLTEEKNKLCMEGTDFQETIVNHLAFNLNYYVTTYHISFLRHTVAAIVNCGGQFFFDMNRLTATQIIQILTQAQESDILLDTLTPESITETIFTIYTGIITALCIHGEGYDFKSALRCLLTPYLTSLNISSKQKKC